eukprot:10625111-Ditylum_brightwellii.AAC.1
MTINARFSTSSTENILIWAQTMRDESWSNISSIVLPVYKCKMEIFADGVTVNGSKDHPLFYEIHDGKMIYSSTQHAKPRHRRSKVRDREAAEQWRKLKEVYVQKLDQAKKKGIAYT